MSLEKSSVNLRKHVPENDPAILAYMESKRQEERQSGYMRVGYFENELHGFDKAQRTAESLLEEAAQFVRAVSPASQHGVAHVARVESQVRRIQERIFSIQEEASLRLRRSFALLLSELLVLEKGAYGEDERVQYVIEELAYMYKPPAIGNALADLLEDSNAPQVSDLMLKISDGRIPTPLLVAMARRHQDKIHEQEKDLDAFVKTTQHDFCEKIRAAVADGWLPNEVLEALPRVNTITVSLKDALQDLTGSTLGLFNHAANHITIRNSLLKPENRAELRHTLFHEFLHVVSGVSYSVAASDTPSSPILKVLRRKSGLTLTANSRRFVFGTWINEAITEWLSIKLSGFNNRTSQYAFDGSQSYIPERKMLARLLESGLSEKALFDAYFESIRISVPATKRGAAFAKLVREINALSHEKHLFTRLENEFVLDTIERTLRHSAFFRSDTELEEHLRRHPEIQALTFTLSIGNRESQVSRTFKYLARDVPVSDYVFPASEQLDVAHKKLETVLRMSDPRIRLEI